MLTEPLRWHGPDNLLILAVFLSVLLAIGLVPLLRAESRLASPLMLGMLCLAGVVGGLVVALNDVFALGIGRAGGGNNPIHFAGLSVTLGFMSLIGLFGTQSAWRLVFLVGPVLAVAVALLSGTHGAVMTVALVTGILVIAFCVFNRSYKPLALAAGATIIAVGGGLLFKPDAIIRAQDGMNQSVIATYALLFAPENGEISSGVDTSTDYRITMLRTAGRAFQDAPFFGHGAGQIIEATRPYYPPRNMGIDAHLHSDIADFMVAGGIVGLLSYLSLLVAPFATLAIAKIGKIVRS